jgi:hypothetical protein
LFCLLKMKCCVRYLHHTTISEPVSQNIQRNKLSTTHCMYIIKHHTQAQDNTKQKIPLVSNWVSLHDSIGSTLSHGQLRAPCLCLLAMRWQPDRSQMIGSNSVACCQTLRRQLSAVSTANVTNTCATLQYSDCHSGIVSNISWFNRARRGLVDRCFTPHDHVVSHWSIDTVKGPRLNRFDRHMMVHSRTK